MSKSKSEQHWSDDEDTVVTEYWLKHYVSSNMLCTLCGNTGIIDTRETAISPVGTQSGRLNWCICRNGQANRILRKREPDEGDL